MTAGPLNSFFASRGWADAWLATLGRDAEPVPLEGSSLLAARRREGFRCLRPAGGEYADYEELPGAEGDGRALARAVEDALAAGDADALVLGHVPDGSATMAWARALRERWGPRVGIAPFGVSLGVELAPTWDEQQARLRKKLVADTRRCERRLGEHEGEPAVERVRDSAAAQATLDFIVRFHRRRNAELGRPSVFDDPAAREFYATLIDRCLGDDRLHLSRLRAGERTAAAHLGFRLDRRFQYYLPVFDPELARYSPSRVLLFGLIQQAIADDVRYLDLGRGELDYKLELNPEQLALWTVAIGRRSARGRAAVEWFTRVRPALADRFRDAAPLLRRAGVLKEYS